MRDYAKVSPQFWTGTTGRALKAAGPEAVIVGLYLMTSPHANMIGLYYCPLTYIAHDTGLGFEGASKGLQSAIEADFCTFEAGSDYVFVHEFATYQIGSSLEPRDLRVKGVSNELAKVPKGQCWQAFRARYAVPFNLPLPSESGSPFKAPTKPGTGAGEEAGEEAGKGNSGPAAPAPPAPPPATTADAGAKRGARLDPEFVLPKPWGQWALTKYPHWTADVVRSIASQFRNHWVAKTGKDATKLDWYATWQNWCDSAITQHQHPLPRAAGRHSGFASKDYTAGVAADGSLA